MTWNLTLPPGFLPQVLTTFNIQPMQLLRHSPSPDIEEENITIGEETLRDCHRYPFIRCSLCPACPNRFTSSPIWSPLSLNLSLLQSLLQALNPIFYWQNCNFVQLSCLPHSQLLLNLSYLCPPFSSSTIFYRRTSTHLHKMARVNQPP